MPRYNVVGLKRYSSAIQNTLDRLCNQEHIQRIEKRLPYTQQLPIEMFSINPMNQAWNDAMNTKHGEHSHYELLNDHALKLLNDYGIKLEIIEQIELEDPIKSGCIVNIINVRFL